MWIVDAVAADSDARAVWVCFVWADGAYNLCERDFVAAVFRDGVIGYKAKGVCAGNSLVFGALVTTADTLAEAAEFICVRCVPSVGIVGMFA